jgi:hypothetical protein
MIWQKYFHLWNLLEISHKGKKKEKKAGEHFGKHNINKWTQKRLLVINTRVLDKVEGAAGSFFITRIFLLSVEDFATWW